MSSEPASTKAITTAESLNPEDQKEDPTSLQDSDTSHSTEDQFATPNDRSRATSLKSVDSKDTLKASDSNNAVTSTEPAPKDGSENQNSAVNEKDGLEKKDAPSNGEEKNGQTASEKGEGKEDKELNEASANQALTKSGEYGQQENTATNGSQKNQNHSNGAAKGSHEDLALGKEVDLEAGQDRSSSGNNESNEHIAEEVDPDIVDWDGPNDPRNARNWPPLLKNGNIAVMSAITFLTPLASSMLAPGVPEVMKDFKSDNLELASFVVSVFVLGYAFGPLVIAPLSEIYGRVPLYHIGNIGFVVFTVACALSKNLNMLIGFRFLEGLFGATPLTIGGGTIADMIVQEKRGGVIAIWALGPLLGPAIGPIAGGFLANSVNWRWIFWVIAIAGGVMAILGFIFFRETYAPVLLERKAKRLRKETGNPNLKSKLASDLAYKDYFKIAIIRPARLLVGSPIVLATSIYVAIVYSYLYLLFTTITEVFEGVYHFSPGIVGLSYLGIGIGCFTGVVIFGVASDRLLKHMSAKGEMKPEYRLPPLIPGSFFVPIGLFIYAWTTHFQVHWIAPIIGTSLVGLGLVAISMPIQTYLVDTFTVYAASASAANIFLRSLLGALLPLAGRQLYVTLGLGWGNSLLAFIALACCPIPIIFFKYGERIRKNKRWNVEL